LFLANKYSSKKSVINFNSAKFVDQGFQNPSQPKRYMKENRNYFPNFSLYNSASLLIPMELFKLETVVLAHHIGSATHEARESTAELVAKNLIAFAKGENPAKSR